MRKLAFLIMIAVMLAALVAPATAAAKGPKTGTPFTAQGLVAVTGTQMHKTVVTGNGVVDIAVHETVESIDAVTSDWEARARPYRNSNSSTPV